MRIVHLTAGAGEGFYCENCLRDGALLRALKQLGHQPVSVPLYLPPLPEASEGVQTTDIFFGGVNVYLQQKLALFRHTPRWLDRVLDSPGLLRWLAKRAGSTNPVDLGRTTLSMLRGEHGRQTKELDRLVDFLDAQGRPDIVCLSNVLLAGAAQRIGEQLGAKVVCLLQDEDGFLDDLPEPYRSEAWDQLERCCQHIDALVPVSRYYAQAMSIRLNLPAAKVHVIPNGIEIDGYAPAARAPDPPVIGYLAPLIEARGFDLLLDAFEILKADGRFATLRLGATGGTLASSQKFVDRIHARITASPFAADVEILDTFDRAAKESFLPSLSVLSVPTRQPEAFGLFVLEALACGVPVVLPDHGAFGELVAQTDGGVLCKPGDAASLAEALAGLLTDEDRRRAMGRAGCDAVRRDFRIDTVAAKTAGLYEQLLSEVQT